MRGPRHVGTCISEWLDECPFEVPATVQSIQEEYMNTTAAREAEAERVLRDPGDVVAGRLAEEAS